MVPSMGWSRWGFVAALAAVVTVGSVLTVGPPESAAAESVAASFYAPVKKPVTDLPALKSTGAKVPVGTIENVGPGDAHVPAKLKPATGKTTTVPSHPDLSNAKVTARDEYSTTFQGQDGSNVSELSPTPINVLSGGAWVPSLTTLQSDASTGAETVPQNTVHPTFQADGAAAGAFAISSDGYKVSYSLEGAEHANLRVSRSTASVTGDDEVSYASVLPDTDLLYQVQQAGVKETLRLAQVPTQTSFSWLVKAPSLTLSVNGDGGVDFTDPQGVIRFRIPTPLMWDSAGVAGEGDNANINVPVTVARDGGDWKVTMTPSRTWLDSPARVYPVYLDPSTWSGGPTTIHAFKTDGTLRTDTMLLGNARDPGDDYWRTVVHYPYEQLFGKQVLNAWLEVAQNAGPGTATSYTGDVDSVTTVSYGGVGTKLADLTVTSTGVTSSGDALAQEISSWVIDSRSGLSLMVRGAEKSGVYTLKSLDSALYVSWVSYPSTPTAVGVSPTGGVRASMTPTFQTSSTDYSGTGINWYYYRIATGSDAETGVVWNSGWISNNPVTVPALVLKPGTKYYYHLFVHDGYYFSTPSNSSSVVHSQVYSFVTNTPGVDAQSGASPADGTVLVSPTPALTAQPGTDVNGDTLKYQFRLTTGSDGASGVVALSPVITSGAISWTVPVGVLQDGVTYSWVVIVDDGYDKSAGTWVNHFRYTTRMGSGGPSPTDTAGGVTVNLASGNANLSFSSPTVSTVGGPMGLSFSYNSQQASTAGLTGTYYDVSGDGANPTFSFTRSDLASKVRLVRTDPMIQFNWGTSNPAPDLPAADYMAQWSGFITPPADGSYTFGFVRDDGARLLLNGTTAIDQWTDAHDTNAQWGSAPELTTGDPGTYSPTPMTVQYYNHTGAGFIELWVKGTYTDSNNVQHSIDMIVPPSWFTKSVETLPPGWTSTTALAGSDTAYVRAEVKEGSVALIDNTGATHTYTRTSSGGYTPPPGEQGVLAEDTNGTYTLTDEAGTVYQFDSSGKVTATTQTLDATNRATPVLAYRTGTNQLSSISDPLSMVSGSYTRQVVFAYSGDTAASVGLTAADTNSSGLACPVPAGYSPAPAGMICRIIYPGHVPGAADTTQLLYKNLTGALDPASGGYQLMEIIDPGNEVTDFGYTNGLLSSIRSATVNDWLAVHTDKDPAGPVTTDIAYDGSNRVASITLPAPDGVTSSLRPRKTYTYATNSDGSGTTYVDAAGLTPPTTAPADGHAATASFDSGWRSTTTLSATGLATSTTWNVKDQTTSTTDPAGRESTTLYDSLGRPTDVYGPAPSSCYGTDQRPLASCAIVPAHTSTAYDGGLHGLNATYYTNTTLSGLPSNYALGVGTSDGTVNKDWAGTAPYTGGPATNWTLRLTGTITFPQSGNYALNTNADDGTRVWINDVLVIDNWVSSGVHLSPTATINATAGQVMRIRVEYLQYTGPSSLQLLWTPPTGTQAVVPGADLSPAYGLATSSQTDDSVPAGVSGVSNSQVPSIKTSTGYDSRYWMGIATSTSVDPTGLNLTTTSTYEPTGAGYLRQLTHKLPAGNTVATNTYYTETDGYATQVNGGTAVCGLPASTPQFGQLMTTTGATPASGTAITTSYVYDLLGRVVGTKSTGDTGWSCTTYDARGRVTQQTYAATATSAARTATFGYTDVNGDPLKSWEQDGGVPASPTGGRIATYTDLLGRVVSYTDVWGTVTTSSYDLVNRLVSQTSTPTGQTAQTQQYVYDADGRVTTVKDGSGSTLAQVTYDSGGDLAQVSYPSGTGAAGPGVTGTWTYSATGALQSIGWAFPNGQSAVSDSVVRSQSGRILTDTLTDGATGYPSSYTYDAAGRLTTASIPHHQLTYAYASTGGCGADTQAGKNGNRTSYTDVLDGGTPDVTTYCYDNADRLTSTTAPTGVTGAAPVAGTSLGAGTIAYDAQGNTTTLADESLGYDQSGRHISTTVAGGSTVTYQRDVTGRIVSRTTTPAGGTATTIRYGFTSDGDGADYTLSTTGTVLEHTLALPGGVIVSQQASTSVWSFSDIHGDVTVTTDQSGVRQGSVALYDPFGNVMDPTTHRIDTVAAADSGPSSTTQTATYGWEGSVQKLDEHESTIATIEMGARQYLPLLGRFLSVDPVAGGNSDSYVYPSDPVNSADLTGQYGTRNIIAGVAANKQPTMTAASSRASGSPSPRAQPANAVCRAGSAEAPDKGVGRGLRAESNVLGTISVVTGIAAIAFSWVPGLDVVLAAVSLTTGAAAAAIDCTDAVMTNGNYVGCGLDIASVALGGAGVAVRGFRAVQGLAPLAEDTMRSIDWAGGGAAFAAGGVGNAAGWGEYAYGG